MIRSALPYLFSIICFWLPANSIAQKNFEGRIVYRLVEYNNNNLPQKIGSIEVFFKPERVKAFVRDSTKLVTKDAVVINMHEGIIYQINLIDSTYRVDSISDRRPSAFPKMEQVPGEKKVVLGHTCSVLMGIDSGKVGIPEQAPDTAIMWLADSLYFPFKSKYATDDVLPIVGNGETITLGFDFRLTMQGTQQHIISTPVLIEEKEISDAVFVVEGKQYQEGYDSKMLEEAVKAAADSAAAAVANIIDSIEKANTQKHIKHKKNIPKKSTSKNTHTQPTKSSALKPKQ